MCSGDNPPEPDQVIEAIRPILNNHFKPALLARMEIVPYYPISKDAMKNITKLKLNQLGKRIQDSQRMKFIYDEKVVEQIAQRCTEVETGARNVDYIINKTLLPQISTQILHQLSEETMPGTLSIGLDAEGGFTYQFS